MEEPPRKTCKIEPMELDPEDLLMRKYNPMHDLDDDENTSDESSLLEEQNETVGEEESKEIPDNGKICSYLVCYSKFELQYEKLCLSRLPLPPTPQKKRELLFKN